MIRLLVQDLTTLGLSNEIRKDLRRMRKGFKGRLRKIGNIIRKRQRALLRAGEGPSIRKIARTGRTGKVRTSSQLVTAHSVVVRRKKGSREVTSLVGGSGDWELFVGTTPGGRGFYGKFSELGTAERSTKAGASRGRVPPRPWMRKAGDLVAGEADREMLKNFDALRIARGG